MKLTLIRLGQTASHSRKFVQPPKPSYSMRRDHGARAGVALRLALRQQAEVRDLGGDEEHRRAVRAGGDAGAAADALGGVHRELGDLASAIGTAFAVGRAAGAHRDEAAGLDDAVEGAAIDHQVLDDRERARRGTARCRSRRRRGSGACGAGTPWCRARLPCGTPLITRPQEPQIPSRQSCSKATGSSPLARSARSLRTSSISRNDMWVVDVVQLVGLEPPRVGRAVLPPDVQRQPHL